MNEEELKKGCGKEAGFITFTDDFGNKDGDVMLCGDTTKKINGEIELFLCDTCQARLECFQKGKLEERERTKMILKEVKDTLLNWEDAQFSISVYRAIHIFIEQFIDVELKRLEGGI